jgi:hypothetical protein
MLESFNLPANSSNQKVNEIIEIFKKRINFNRNEEFKYRKELS